ncbi:glycosyl transferase family 1 [Paraburkholderia ginsengiterrae]|uniref:Glycosyl transferase family 1 n=1 Tax=Paraburkholderia ginsengiterrae TaxID=1462993 RepID=A0A1A9MYN5_9BURK|nr:glycosyltransferase family 4 protein [Paraburkholderia ginsengiterrae]OAJ53695.1 glycosyl transferase family 1 [Paraburkholderia ginsengiterrae]OAJ54722.1 glycosyl transferase family 1 [Paraburkholderia ginsengiterrae]
MKVVLFANTEWYLYNFKLSLAHELRDRGCDVVLLSPPGEYAARLEQAGFVWREVPMHRRSINPFRELRVIMQLSKLLAAEKPDVVHNFTIKCAVYGSIASKLVGTRGIVNSIAGLGFVFTSRKLLARLLQPVVKGLFRVSLGGVRSTVIVQNPDDLAFFNSADWLKAREVCLIKGSGVSLTRFRDRDRQSVLDRSKPLRLVLAARLLWDKGVREFIDAAKYLKAESPNCRFILAGTPDGGNPNSVSDEQIQKWQSEGIVEWLGHVSDMPKLFDEVDVIVLPSYREGLPKSLIEAAACGLAIVTTDAPGCKEVVNDDGKNGLLVPVRDALALARAIQRLEEDRTLCMSLGEAARERVLLEFDERIVIDKTIAVYEQLTNVTFQRVAPEVQQAGIPS